MLTFYRPAISPGVVLLRLHFKLNHRYVFNLPFTSTPVQRLGSAAVTPYVWRAHGYQPRLAQTDVVR